MRAQAADPAQLPFRSGRPYAAAISGTVLVGEGCTGGSGGRLHRTSTRASGRRCGMAAAGYA